MPVLEPTVEVFLRARLHFVLGLSQMDLGMMHSGGRPFNDIDGLELPDIEAARAEAIGLARDLMRMEPEQQDWSRGPFKSPFR
jgi:hypothetical protein